MNSLFEKLLGEAAQLTRGAKLSEATAAIQRALLGTPPVAQAAGAGESAVLDGLVREIPRARVTPEGRPYRVPPPLNTAPRPTSAPRSAPGTAARFQEHSYSGASGSRTYKLFVPALDRDRPLPLIVMLHGCTQSPDDFAAGTRMNEIAQERGFLVLYPAQAPRSNQSKCWNWFTPGDQRRGRGEPELLAGMTRHVAQTHNVDARRVYVAGLSAGGAMADILGREYPDLYAAVGVHSGLPQGAAHDVASAFAAMSKGASASAAAGLPRTRRPADKSRTGRPGAPTIVFHGDADGTVHSSNGEQVIGAALRSGVGSSTNATATSSSSSFGGRRFTHTVHRRADAAASDPSLAEHWVVHGGGHAWSGGSQAGSYTDAQGPNASQEMTRFFEEHPQRGV